MVKNLFKYKLNHKHIDQLDVFRALAALSVCSVHFTYESFFHNYFAEGLFVQLFFTLSGFVIAYNYHDNLKNIKMFFEFIIKRLRRLYPLHLFFLLSFLILEIVKYILTTKFNFQSNNLPFEYNNLKNFLLNILFIQHFATEYNFNAPSWSISVEIMLYITFGLILLIFKNKFLLTCLYFLYIIFFIIFLSSHYGKSLSISAFYSGLYSFSIGYLFFYLYKMNHSFQYKNVCLDLVFYILLLLFLLEIFYLEIIKYKYFYSIIFGFIFFYSCFLKKNFFLFKILFNSFFIFLGKISYSIYMSHVTIFFLFDNFLKHILKHETKIVESNLVLNLNSFEANSYTILIYILVIFFSSFTYKFIEMKYYKK
jgi:peptidoglycan/LPS O-acetylase OafA/YrhL